jgi:hypothetical protein
MIAEIIDLTTDELEQPLLVERSLEDVLKMHDRYIRKVKRDVKALLAHLDSRPRKRNFESFKRSQSSEAFETLHLLKRVRCATITFRDEFARTELAQSTT